MRHSVWSAPLCLAMLALTVGACGGGPTRSAVMSAGRLPPSAVLLLRYDADGNGNVTRDEMEAGLKAEFAAADSNSDSCIDREEVRIENNRRLTQDRGQASPLTDWNLDGCVDATEFGNTVRSYFTLADKTKDNAVSQQELRGPAMPMAPRSAEGVQQRAPTIDRPDEISRNTPQF